MLQHLEWCKSNWSMTSNWTYSFWFKEKESLQQCWHSVKTHCEIYSDSISWFNCLTTFLMLSLQLYIFDLPIFMWLMNHAGFHTWITGISFVFHAIGMKSWFIRTVSIWQPQQKPFSELILPLFLLRSIQSVPWENRCARQTRPMIETVVGKSM